MKISYAITVKDELSEIQRLVSLLLNYKRSQDEIVILLDETNGSKQVEEYLRTHSSNNEFLWIAKPFYNHFADWKNTLASLCDGDFIFQIDADEYPNEQLIASLPEILESNPEIDLYWIPRINTVEGITPEHIKQWRWMVNENGWINFPDYQSRLYRKIQNITWVNKVHERIDGAKVFTHFPAEEDFCLYHPKTIERQEKQNNYYNTL
jgi:glycosyltransferase involved in cell wall biosynthesis